MRIPSFQEFLSKNTLRLPDALAINYRFSSILAPQSDDDKAESSGKFGRGREFGTTKCNSIGKKMMSGRGLKEKATT